MLNDQELTQGAWDSPLTQEGIEGARLAGEFFKKQGIGFNYGFCSTSERASDTLELIDPDLPYQREKGLKEYNFGLYEGKPMFLSPKPPFKDYFKAFGGESDDEVSARINQALLKAMNQAGEGNTLIVSHGGAIRHFLERWTDFPIHSNLPNCSIFVFDFDDQKQSFELLEFIPPEKQELFLSNREF